MPVGRPLNTTPAYGIWQQQRAVFGQSYGMEQVNYFALQGEPLFETPSLRRSNAFKAVANECRTVRTAVGITEIHNFGKYKVNGTGARDWLNTIMAGRLPQPGRITLSPMLSYSGKLIGDFTISALAKDQFQLTAAFSAQAYHMRWFLQHLPESGVDVTNISNKRVGFQIAGPNARKVLTSCTRFDISNKALPFLSVKHLEIGQCDAIVQRVSYTGELGYEIYVDINQQISLYQTLIAAGKSLGMRPFGMRAMMSLRLEKSFGAWLREFKPDYTPMETGMDNFINYQKETDYIGKAAVLAELENPPARRLVTLMVDALDADVVADEPIWRNGKVVGYVTSGGYAHYVGKSVAIGFIPIAMITEDATFAIEILGKLRPARLSLRPLFDPKAERMHS